MAIASAITRPALVHMPAPEAVGAMIPVFPASYRGSDELVAMDASERLVCFRSRWTCQPGALSAGMVFGFTVVKLLPGFVVEIRVVICE